MNILYGSTGWLKLSSEVGRHDQFGCQVDLQQPYLSREQYWLTYL